MGVAEVGLECPAPCSLAEPLQQLCRSRFGLAAEDALDLVHGFFASRLAGFGLFLRGRLRGLALRRIDEA